MEWTFYITETRPNPLAEVLELMRIGHEHIVQLLLAGIIGLGSIAVTFMKEIKDEVQTLKIMSSETRAENTLRFNQHSYSLQDHEQRIRFIERKTNK